MMVAMPTHKPMKPPFSYYGGKQRMAGKIIPLLPQHTVYVEPFCGSATIMFKKPWPEVKDTTHYREVINDHDSRVVNFFRVLRDPIDGPELIRRIELTPYSEQKNKEAGKVKTGNTIDDALWYFLVVNTSVGNDIGGGWRRGKYSENGPLSYQEKIKRLYAYIGRMMETHIAHQDALTIIRQWDSPQTLFYLDPPYPGAGQGHYSGYTSEDFAKLVSALSSCQGSFVLSNYEQPGVPDSWEKFTFDVLTSARPVAINSRKRTEVVWRRFNTVPVRPEIQKLYDSGKFDCFVPRPKDLPYANS